MGRQLLLEVLSASATALCLFDAVCSAWRLRRRVTSQATYGKTKRFCLSDILMMGNDHLSRQARDGHKTRLKTNAAFVPSARDAPTGVLLQELLRLQAQSPSSNVVPIVFDLLIGASPDAIKADAVRNR